MEIINIADLTNPKTGKTYREENNAKKHKYRINDLVEIIPWDKDCNYAGMRLYIIGCVRDCDGTPLYAFWYSSIPLVPSTYNGVPSQSLTHPIIYNLIPA